MNKIVIIYHTDLDGYGVKVAGRIYANQKGYEDKDIVFIRADYYKNANSKKKLFIDDLIDEHIKGHESEIDEIILGDISVKSEEKAEYLNELSKTKKVILRDHHDTATWMNKYEWAKVRETDDDGIARSGTYWTAKELLSDEYIEKHPNLKKFIYLTDKFDAWTWAKSNPKLDKAVDLALLFSGMNEEGFDADIYPKLLLEEEIELFDEKMKFYLKIKNEDLRRQLWAAYFSLKSGVYTYKDGDKEIPLKVAVVSTENGSIIAEKLREIFAMKHEEYDFILNFGLNGGLALRCSENPKVPVNKILMQMGDGSGGGHICSAGGVFLEKAGHDKNGIPHADFRHAVGAAGGTVDFAKTRPVFDGYKAARYSRKYLAQHEAELAAYRAAKAAMNDLLGGAKLPKMDTLKKERRELSEKKKALYAEYRKAQADMRQAVAVKANIDYLLGHTDGRENKAQER